MTTQAQQFPGFPKSIRHMSDLRDALGIVALHTNDDEQRYNEISKPYREALKLCTDMEVAAREKRMDEVLEKAKRVLELFPSLFEALRARADSLFVKEDWSNSRLAYFELLSQHPDAPDIHYQLGRCYFEIGDIDSAIKEFELEMKTSGEAPDLYLQLGGLHSSRGEKNLTKYSEEQTSANHELYRACQADFEKAAQFFQKGLTIDPQNRDLRAMLQTALSVLDKLR